MGALRLFQGTSPDYRSLFDDFWADNGVNTHSKKCYLPSVNIKETGETYTIDVAAPGLSREDFKVSIEHDVLTISSHAEQKKEEKEDTSEYTRKEFSTCFASRSFSLPEYSIDKEAVSATYENGILKVILPKAVGDKPQTVKLIPIS